MAMVRKGTASSKTSSHALVTRVLLPGSERPPIAQATGEGAGKLGNGRITVSVILRPRSPLPDPAVATARLSRAQYRAQHGVDPAALKALRTFARQWALSVADTPAMQERRTVQLTGTRTALQEAFGATLKAHRQDGVTYRVREGSLHLPEMIAPYVEAVLGLDDRPQAKPHFRIAKGTAAANGGQAGRVVGAKATTGSFTPPQIAALYQFPVGASAKGQTIGIIELGGGYRKADITAYFKSLGQTAPRVKAVLVDGGKNSPSTVNSADGEVMLDIEVAGAVAPGAGIVVYFAPNTDQGFVDAISTAVHDNTNKPSVISISWGGPESSWTGQAVTALDGACQAAAALGVTITAASGDDGSADGVSDGGNHVDFPASSPNVLGCGGTKLVESNGSITSEVVWNEQASQQGATGGGVSTLFPRPAWQSTSNVPAPPGSTGGRGVPDVAGDADPATGYDVRVDGQNIAVGGTSAVAPLWAGLIALSNAQNKKTAGFINAALYGAGAGVFRDITNGDNGSFTASAGWDPCTGLGSPIGSGVIAALAQVSSGNRPGKKKNPPKKKTMATPKQADLNGFRRSR